MARVFLSHTGSDDAIATEIHRWLLEGGHEVFLDHDLRDGVTIGEEWERRLHERLRWADALVCVVSPAYIESTWCSAEVGAARSRGTLILPLSTQPGVIHPLLGFVHHVPLAEDEGAAREKLADTLRRVEYGGGAGWPDDRSPFPGLHPFDRDMRQAFFGRSADVAQLVGLLRSPAQRSENALLLVVGPSGCGKSSLVRAGLVPGMAEEPDWWCLPPLLPGPDPILALSRELARAARLAGLTWTVAHVRDRLTRSGLTEVADELLLATTNGRARRMLIALDQLDELLTLTPPDLRKTFVELIRPALADSVQFVATLRPEFLEALLADPALGPLPTRVVPVSALPRDALHEVIEGPARLARIRIGGELVSRLVADTGDGEALPLLAFTLAQLAEGLSPGEGGARELSAARYDELGGVQGALITQADLALEEAVAAGGRSRDRVIDGLLRLVTVDEHGRPTRRRVARADLPTEVAAELDAFVARRLLATDTDTEDGEVVVGVAHEAFLSAWPPLATAVAERTVALRARSAVEETANIWERERRTHARLWERGQLAAAVADTGVRRTGPLGSRTLDSPHVDLSDRARDFLMASIRRDRRRRRTATTVLSALLAVAVVAAGVAVLRQNQAEDLQRLATARQLMAQADSARATDPQTALRLGIAAHHVRPDEQTIGALVAGLNVTPYAGTLTGHTAEIRTVAFTEDGGYMATSAIDGHPILWELGDEGRPRQLGERLTSDAGLYGAVFSPDGTVLATTTSDDSVILWDLADPEHPVPLGPPLPSGSEQLGWVRFAPDGNLLALGGSFPATVTLWDISDPADASRLGDPIRAGESMELVEFDASGRFLLTGSSDEDFDNELVRWDLDDPVTHRRLGQPLTYDTPAVFDADSGLVASVSEEFESDVLLTSLDDPARPRHVGTVSTYGSGANSIAFSPDAKTLAVSSHGDRNDESLVGRWDISDPADPVDLSADRFELGEGSSGSVTSLDSFARVAQLHEMVFLADPDMLLTISGDDQRVTRWDFSDPTQPRETGSPIVAATGLHPAVVVLPDGRTVATGRADGALLLWDLSAAGTPARAGAIELGERPVVSVRYPAGGDTIDVGLNDGEVQTWRVDDPADPQQTGDLAADPPAEGAVVAFDSSGSLLARSDAESVTIVDLADPSRTARIAKPYFPGRAGSGVVGDLKFSPDGDVLAIAVSAGGFGGYAVLYDTRDPMDPHRLGSALDPIDFGDSLAFSQDGSTLAFAGIPGAFLFDIAEPAGAELRGLISGDTGAFASLAFSPDGQVLAIGTDDDFAVTLWDVSDPAAPTRIGLPLTGHRDRVTAVAFAPDGRTLATGDAQGVVAFWDLTDSTRPRQLGSLQTMHDGSVNSISFVEDSSAMATGGADGTVVLVGFDALVDLREHAAAKACDRVGPGLSREEWERYIPDLPFVETCPGAA